MSLERLEVKVINYGSRSKPKYTIDLELKVSLTAEPDDVHCLCVEERLITSKTVPTSPVVNFRGSMDGERPYYRAILLGKDGLSQEYVVEAKYKGGFSNITYEPSIKPSHLKYVHPTHFKQMGFKVLNYELNNYRFTSGLKRYEEFHLEVYEGLEGGSTLIARAKEASLNDLKPPCEENINTLSKVLEGFGLAKIKEAIIDRLQG